MADLNELYRQLAFYQSGGGREVEPTQAELLAKLLGGTIAPVVKKFAPEDPLKQAEAMEKQEKVKALQRESTPIFRTANIPQEPEELKKKFRETLTGQATFTPEEEAELAEKTRQIALPFSSQPYDLEEEPAIINRINFLRGKKAQVGLRQEEEAMLTKLVEEQATKRGELGVTSETEKFTPSQYETFTKSQLYKAGVPLKEAQAEKTRRTETIDVDKIISESTGIPVGKIPKAQYDATLKALNLQAKSNPNKPLTPYQAMILGVPFGTSAIDASGIIPKTPEDRKKIQQLNASDVIIDDLSRLSSLVNTFEAGSFGLERLIKGGQNVVESFLQTNPDAKLLESQGAKLATLMRSLGEVGVLTDKDIERGQQLIPVITDTKTVADRKINELRNFFSNIKASQIESITTPIRKETPKPQGTQPTKPEASQKANDYLKSLGLRK